MNDNVFNAKSKDARVLKENPNPIFIPPPLKRKEKIHMTGKEYCDTCCHRDVCKIKDDFINYCDESNKTIKNHPEFYNDITCTKRLTDYDTLQSR